MNPITESRAQVRIIRARSSYINSDYRTAISLLHAAQDDIESASGRTSEWWHLRTKEAHNHRMRGDHESCIAVALPALARGNEIEPADRMDCEVDLLASCIETRPLALIDKLAEEILSQDRFEDNARGACFKHYTLGLLAQRRGDHGGAFSHFARSWEFRRHGRFSGYTRMVHLVKCVEMACGLGDQAEASRWLGVMENAGNEIPCDDVRWRHARVLVLHMEPFSAAIGATIREVAQGGLRHAAERPEKIHYWNYILGLLYGLASAGDVAGAHRYTALLPDWPPFERKLWETDLAWFSAADTHGLPVPNLAPTPVGAPRECAHALPAAVVAELQAGYRATRERALAEDTRLACDWRTRLISARLSILEGAHDAE